MMDPKLLRMYSDILSEVIDPRYANQARADAAKKAANAPPAQSFAQTFPQAGNKTVSPQSQSLRSAFASSLGFGDKPSQSALPTTTASTPVPTYQKDPGQNKKVGTGASGFGATTPKQSALPKTTTPKTAAPAIDPRVAAARKADAKQQAAAPAPGTTQDPSGGQGNAAFLPGAAGGAKPVSTQTTPDQMPTTSASNAQSIGFTGPGTEPAAPTATNQSSYTSPTGVALGAEKPEEPGTGASSYTSTAGASMGAGGQSSMPSGGGMVGTKLAGDTNVKTQDYSKADLAPGNYMRAATTAFKEEEKNEIDQEINQDIEKELAEAFNDMLRLSGLEKKKFRRV